MPQPLFDPWVVSFYWGAILSWDSEKHRVGSFPVLLALFPE
jgi:hypothetical protein